MLNPQESGKERRRRRSGSPELAIGYQLDQVVREFDLDCCLIVDDEASIVAISPESPTPFMESLASLLPTIATLPHYREQHLAPLRRHRPDLDAGELTACVFRAGGRRLFIGAIGQKAVMNEIGIFRAITGARRIHSSQS